MARDITRRSPPSARTARRPRCFARSWRASSRRCVAWASPSAAGSASSSSMRAQRRLRRLDLLLAARPRSAPAPPPASLCCSAVRRAFASCARRSFRPALGPGRERCLRALLADSHVLRPAADVAVQRPRPRSRPSACRPRRAAPGRARRAAASPGTAFSAASSASRLSRSRWLVGSSRISTFAPEWTRIASDSRRRSPPDRPSSGFSASSPENRKSPEQRPRLGRASARSRAASPRAPSARVPAPSSSACWERKPSLTLWPVRSFPSTRPAQPPPSSSRRPASVSISVVLPVAVGADQRHVLAALEPQLGVVEQLLVAGRDATRPRARRRPGRCARAA